MNSFKQFYLCFKTKERRFGRVPLNHILFNTPLLCFVHHLNPEYLDVTFKLVRQPSIFSLFKVHRVLNPLQADDLPLNVWSITVLFRPVPYYVPILCRNVPKFLPQLVHFFIYFDHFYTNFIIDLFTLLSSFFEIDDMSCQPCCTCVVPKSFLLSNQCLSSRLLFQPCLLHFPLNHFELTLVVTHESQSYLLPNMLITMIQRVKGC